MTLDSGAYFANYTGCPECSAFRISNRDREATEDEDGNEVVSYSRTSVSVCGGCVSV